MHSRVTDIRAAHLIRSALLVFPLNKSQQITQSKKMEPFYGKKYKLETSNNFDEFMKTLGVGLVTRKMGNAVSPVVELTKNGDEYTLSSSSTFKNVVIKFKLGEEFDQETADGRKVKALITADGPTLHEIQTNEDGSKTTIDRTWTADEIKMDMEAKGVKASRIYKIQ